MTGHPPRIFLLQPAFAQSIKGHTLTDLSALEMPGEGQASEVKEIGTKNEDDMQIDSESEETGVSDGDYNDGAQGKRGSGNDDDDDDGEYENMIGRKLRPCPRPFCLFSPV